VQQESERVSGLWQGFAAGVCGRGFAKGRHGDGGGWGELDEEECDGAAEVGWEAPGGGGGVEAGGEERTGAAAVLHSQLQDLRGSGGVLRLRAVGVPGRDQRAQPVARALRHGGGHVGDSLPLCHARGRAQGLRPCRQVHGSHGQG
jgi:hypothetical protein